MTDIVRIATRKSPLALWQAEFVKAELERFHSGIQVELVPMSTRGDKILDVALAKVGGKGLFVKELEVAMEDGLADIAVHSMKDVPMMLPTGFPRKINCFCHFQQCFTVKLSYWLVDQTLRLIFYAGMSVLD